MDLGDLGNLGSQTGKQRVRQVIRKSDRQVILIMVCTCTSTIAPLSRRSGVLGHTGQSYTCRKKWILQSGSIQQDESERCGSLGHSHTDLSAPLLLGNQGILEVQVPLGAHAPPLHRLYPVLEDLKVLVNPLALKLLGSLCLPGKQ